MEGGEFHEYDEARGRHGADEQGGVNTICTKETGPPRDSVVEGVEMVMQGFITSTDDRLFVSLSL